MIYNFEKNVLLFVYAIIRCLLENIFLKNNEFHIPIIL